MSKDKKHTYENVQYNIVAYDHSWVMQFNEYAAKIKNIFEGGVEIEHIGSTSVEGMSGKSCIDVLVVVDEIKTVESNVLQMEQSGFQYIGEFVMKDSTLFRVIKENSIISNVHFFPKEHRHIAEMIDLRNYLRSNEDEVKEYSKLKNELYKKYPNDYASYRKYKDEYMDKLMQRIY